MVHRCAVEPRNPVRSRWSFDPAAGRRHDHRNGEDFVSPMIATMKLQHLRQAMHAISAKKGDFTFFGVFLRAEGIGSWDLVVSAPWLEAGKLRALEEFVRLLSNEIGKESFREFSQVATLKLGDPGLETVLTQFKVRDGEEHVGRTRLFGLEIEEGIIFRSQGPSRRGHSVSGRE